MCQVVASLVELGEDSKVLEEREKRIRGALDQKFYFSKQSEEDGKTHYCEQLKELHARTLDLVESEYFQETFASVSESLFAAFRAEALSAFEREYCEGAADAAVALPKVITLLFRLSEGLGSRHENRISFSINRSVRRRVERKRARMAKQLAGEEEKKTESGPVCETIEEEAKGQPSQEKEPEQEKRELDEDSCSEDEEETEEGEEERTELVEGR